MRPAHALNLYNRETRFTSYGRGYSMTTANV